MSKDTYYFSHDFNARNDPKIMAMRNVYKSEGYGWFWIVIETMAEQEDYKLKHCQWLTNALAMAMQCEVDSVAEFINSCVKEFELFSSDGEFFWSESLIKRMAMRDQKRKNREEIGRKGAKKRWGNSNALVNHCLTNSSPIVTDSKERKGKESKVNNKTYSAFFESVWSLYPNKKGKATIKPKQVEILQGLGYEKIKVCIDRYKASKPSWQEWQNGSTFFNSGYVDYLDENYQEPERKEDWSDF